MLIFCRTLYLDVQHIHALVLVLDLMQYLVKVCIVCLMELDEDDTIGLIAL